MSDPPSPSPNPAASGLRLAAVIALAGAFALLVVSLVVLMIWRSEVPTIPDADSLWTMRRSPGMRFVDDQGALIATRGARYGDRVSLKTLPAFTPNAFLAAEDRRFYQHGAIDLRGVLRAARRDMALGRAAEGGSTIAQQLARTLFLGREQSLRRKVQEAILAGRLEDELGRDGVLELYLNRAYFGAGAYGLDSAARVYFGKPATQLDLGESALLAAVVNAPTRLSPLNDMASAWARARRVLTIMVREGWATPEQADEAASSPPTLAPARGGEGEWSYALDQAASQASGLVGDSARDLVVHLTVDAKLQSAGVSALRAGVLGQGAGRNVTQGALVALAPDGAIRVMVGGVDAAKSAYNRVTQAHRQPGSSFKAFVFGAAMETGLRPDDTREDAAINVGDWTPEDYGRRFSGKVTLAKAFALSLNSVSVRLTLELTPASVASFARRCGLTTIPPDPGASIALGAYEVIPLQLAAGYQVFQTGGKTTSPYLVSEIDDTAGRVLYSRGVQPSGTALDPLSASRMVRMMEGVITGGTGTAANIGRPAAGKTGTSQHFRDAWFVGFTPDLLAAVWVGNDNGSPMAHVTGGEIPASIWKRFMLAAEADKPAEDFAWLEPEPQIPPETVDASDKDVEVSAPPIDDPAPVDEAPDTAAPSSTDTRDSRPAPTPEPADPAPPEATPGPETPPSSIGYDRKP